MATYVAQPQTSRAGLITTIVILCVLLIGVTVTLFVKYNEGEKTRIEYEQFRQKYAEAVSQPELSTTPYHDAQAQLKPRHLKSVFELQNQDIQQLETVITGTGSAEAAEQGRTAAAQNNTQLTKYATEAGMTVPTASTTLVEGFRPWPQIADHLIAEREDLKNQVAAAKTAADEAKKATETSLADKDKKIGELNQQIADAQKQIAELQKTQGDNLNTVKTGADQSLANVTQQLQNTQGQLAQLTGQLAGVTKQRDNLLLVLRRFKANSSPKEDIIRVPDGVITSVNGDNVFINLGEGDQIYRGMTFEIYDPIKGIPPLGDGTSSTVAYTPKTSAAGAATPAGVAALASARRNADKYQFEMPKGKGSIEVIGVGPGHQSICRVVKKEEGQTIAQGDLIGNLVYDRNIKYNFFIYGDFDLSGSNNNNARANGHDLPVIRRLIEQWGANAQVPADAAKPADSVTPETDFVIVGREPFIPNFTPDDLTNPDNVAILDKAKTRAAAYQSVLTKAAELGIPVLNQPRFLYYIGYFDQARR